MRLSHVFLADRHRTAARRVLGGLPRLMLAVLLATISGCALLSGSGQGKAAGNDHNGAPSAAVVEAAAKGLQPTPAVPGHDRQKRLAAALAAIYSDDATRQGLHYVADFGNLDNNGIATAAAFVFRNGSCTEGCNLFLLKQEGERFVVINRIPNVRPPLYRLAQTNDGWHQLLTTTIDSAGGPDRQRLQYANGRYALVADNRAFDAHRTSLIGNLSGDVHSLPASSAASR